MHGAELKTGQAWASNLSMGQTIEPLAGSMCISPVVMSEKVCILSPQLGQQRQWACFDHWSSVPDMPDFA